MPLALLASSCNIVAAPRFGQIGQRVPTTIGRVKTGCRNHRMIVGIRAGHVARLHAADAVDFPGMCCQVPVNILTEILES